jgi:hypothetical protein
VLKCALVILAMGTVWSAWGSGKEAESLGAALKEQQDALAESQKAQESAEKQSSETQRSCDESKKVTSDCAATYRQGRPYAQFYADLSGEEKRGYPVPNCGPLPPWRRGETNVRVSAWPTREQAEGNLDTIRGLAGLHGS